MIRHPQQRPRLGKLVLATGLVIALLNACSSKPPACGDEQTVNLVKEIIVDHWKESTTVNTPKDETSQYVADYANGLKVEVRDIVSDGYNADARKHSCTGVIVLKTITGASVSAPRDFTSQATADGNGKFVVQVAAVDLLVRSLNADLLHYAVAANNKRLVEAKKATEAADQQTQACIDSRMAAWDKDFQARQHALMEEAEKENREFRPLSVVYEEESKEAAMQQAQQACKK